MAGPAQATGAAAATVVQPGTMVPANGLRFGHFMQPTALGTLTVGPDGSVSATGGMTGNYNITQPPPGRGPGSFVLVGRKNGVLKVTLPLTVTVSNGTSQMLITALNANINNGTVLKLDAAGLGYLTIGGTLAVAANQPYGQYTGTYNVTVVFQ